MKVLHVTASAAHGGGGEHLWLLLRHLDRHGVESLVAAPRDEPYWRRYADCVGGERMLEIPHRSFRPGALLRLTAFAKIRGADLLHSHGKGAGLYARLTGLLAGIPCAHTYHGIHRGRMSVSAWRLYCLLERALGQATRAAVAVSAGEQGEILDLGFCPAQRLRLIPNGVLCPQDISAVPAEARRDIVHVTRFDPAQKNSGALVPVALELQRAGRLGRFRFMVLGEGPGRAPLEAEIRRLGMEEHFLFAGAVDSIRPRLKAAFCCLSTSRWEGLPLFLLEAMSEGVPVVASRVVGNSDAVAHGAAGLLYTLDDHAAAAAQILRLADEPGLWQSLADAARRRACAEFNAEAMAARTAALYRACLA